MKIAILTLTKGGIKLGLKLQKYLKDAELYIPFKFAEEVKSPAVQTFEESMKELAGRLFRQYDFLIFIMAAGIVVRSISPYLKSKQSDPAVIVMDEKGKNIISLLSGHLGGANDFTLRIAALIHGNPVITTASDVNGKIAVDTLSMALNCSIESYQDAASVTAHIVNGERVGLITSIPIDRHLPENIIIIDSNGLSGGEYKGAIVITEKSDFKKPDCDTAVLRPRNIILGIGCRRGTSKENILNAIEDVLQLHDISPLSVRHIATVDVKENEPGLREAADALGVSLVAVHRDNILEVEEKFQVSSFVKNAIGVGAVCEPSALLSSKNGTLIMGKKKYAGVTIAVVREGEV